MRCKTTHAERRGVFLIEMLVMLAAFAILLTVTTLTLLALAKVENADALAFKHVLQRSALAERFRTDVSDAREAPQSWKDFKQGPACLILRGDRGHIVYLAKRGSLERRSDAGKEASLQQLPAGGDRVLAEFLRAKELITLRLLDESTRRPPAEFSAVLGGNWK